MSVAKTHGTANAKTQTLKCSYSIRALGFRFVGVAGAKSPTATLNGVETLELEEIKGIGESIAKRLRAAGFVNAESVAVTPAKELMRRADYKELPPALRIVEAAFTALGNPFITAWERFQTEKQRLTCTTGSRAIDDILGGGVKTKEITEFGGKNGTGKTQVCHSLSVKAQLKPSEGGFGGEVLYYDTEGTFSARRLY